MANQDGVKKLFNFGSNESKLSELCERYGRTCFDETILAQPLPVLTFLLAHISRPDAARILAKVPQADRSELLIRLSKLKEAGVETTQLLVEELEKQMQKLGQSKVQLGGKQKIADLLRDLPDDISHKLLSGLGQVSPALAQDIEQKMQKFSDILYLVPSDFSLLYFSLDLPTRQAAFCDLSPDLEAHLSQCLSERALADLKDDSLPKYSKGLKEKARLRVLAQLQRLAAEGKIKPRDPREKYV